MINSAEYQRLKQGCFASIDVGGLTLSGFAAQDPEEPQRVRFDCLAEEDDGSFVQFSLRIAEENIESVQFLLTPPTFSNSIGNEVTMDASFWPDMDEE